MIWNPDRRTCHHEVRGGSCKAPFVTKKPPAEVWWLLHLTQLEGSSVRFAVRAQAPKFLRIPSGQSAAWAVVKSLRANRSGIIASMVGDSRKLSAGFRAYELGLRKAGLDVGPGAALDKTSLCHSVPAWQVGCCGTGAWATSSPPHEVRRRRHGQGQGQES